MTALLLTNVGASRGWTVDLDGEVCKRVFFSCNRKRRGAPSKTVKPNLRSPPRAFLPKFRRRSVHEGFGQSASGVAPVLGGAKLACTHAVTKTSRCTISCPLLNKHYLGDIRNTKPVSEPSDEQETINH